MDLLLIAAALTAGLAGFYVVLGFQEALTGTGKIVRARLAEPERQVPGAISLLASLQKEKRRFNIVNDRTELELIRAGWAIKVSEYYFLRFFLAGLGGLLAILLTSVASFESGGLKLFLAVLGVIVGYVLPGRIVAYRKDKRMREIEDQLPHTLTSMAKSLRAGAGLLQAMDYAAAETPEPLGPELRRTMRDLQLGGDAELVFGELNRRIGSRDLEIASTAIMIQRSVGGNLSEILTNVSETIRDRQAVMAEVRVMTSRQRLQANLTAALPVAVAFAFFAINPGVAGLLVNEKTGNIALGVGIFFEIFGIWLIRRLAVIEV